MSSRVVVETLKFCTCSRETICTALNILGIKCIVENNNILIGKDIIYCVDSVCYMQILKNDYYLFDLFHKINSKVAELESQLKSIRLRENRHAQEKAKVEEERYRLRELKREEEELLYQERKLEMEKQNFIEAKKLAIIRLAQEKGYSIKESSENGVIKLKLIKRIY